MHTADVQRTGAFGRSFRFVVYNVFNPLQQNGSVTSTSSGGDGNLAGFGGATAGRRFTALRPPFALRRAV